MLPIRQTLSALPFLKAGPKAVLIEVCELAENGGRGCFDAKNGYLVDRLGATERTITRALTLLEQRGLLLCQGQGKARQLVPSAALRACYVAHTELTRRLAVAALNLDKNGPEPRQNGEVDEDTNLDKSGDEPRQKWSSNLDKNGGNLDKSGRAYKETTNTTSNDQYDQGVGEENVVVGLKKKIRELEAEIRQLKAQAPAPSAPVARPPSFPFGRDPEVFPPQLTLPFATDGFRAAWTSWRRYRAEIDKAFRGDISEQADLDKCGTLAAGSEATALKIITDSIANGWKNLTLHLETHGSSNRRNNGPAAAAGRVSALSASDYTSGRNRSSAA